MYKLFIVLGCVVLASGCAITRPVSELASQPKLTPCPWTPNCVSTEAKKNSQRIAPFKLAVDIEMAWPKIVNAVNALPGASIKQKRTGYLYAKHHSKVFKFVDYLEVLHLPQQHHLAVRASARFGLSDFNVNRKRTETLRTALIEQGVIHQ